MKILKYVSRIRCLHNSLKKQERVRVGSHVLLMNKDDYQKLFSSVFDGDDREGKYLTSSKFLLVSMPGIAKKKMKVMKYAKYLVLWNKYRKHYEKRKGIKNDQG